PHGRRARADPWLAGERGGKACGDRRHRRRRADHVLPARPDAARSSDQQPAVVRREGDAGAAVSTVPPRLFARNCAVLLLEQLLFASLVECAAVLAWGKPPNGRSGSSRNSPVTAMNRLRPTIGCTRSSTAATACTRGWKAGRHNF